MKTVTTILAAIVFTILSLTSVNTVNASPRVGIYTAYETPVVISAHPRHRRIWVEGRYVRRHRRLVWVPGYWKRF